MSYYILSIFSLSPESLKFRFRFYFISLILPKLLNGNIDLILYYKYKRLFLVHHCTGLLQYEWNMAFIKIGQFNRGSTKRM